MCANFCMSASFHVVDAILVCVLLDLPLVLARMGLKKLRPKATVAEGATVAYNYEAFFGTRYRHVDAPSACAALKESNVLVAVAAHA